MPQSQSFTVGGYSNLTICLPCAPGCMGSTGLTFRVAHRNQEVAAIERAVPTIAYRLSAHPQVKEVTIRRLTIQEVVHFDVRCNATPDKMKEVASELLELVKVNTQLVPEQRNRRQPAFA